jgi:hypothetical protein
VIRQLDGSDPLFNTTKAHLLGYKQQNQSAEFSDDFNGSHNVLIEIRKLFRRDPKLSMHSAADFLYGIA